MYIWKKSAGKPEFDLAPGSCDHFKVKSAGGLAGALLAEEEP
jgi:hypothetical protein